MLTRLFVLQQPDAVTSLIASALLLAAKQRNATLPLAENFVVSAISTGGSVLAAAVRAITKVIDKVTCAGFSEVMTGMDLMALTMSAGCTTNDYRSKVPQCQKHAGSLTVTPRCYCTCCNVGYGLQMQKDWLRTGASTSSSSRPSSSRHLWQGACLRRAQW
jgi:hypothetical protein